MTEPMSADPVAEVLHQHREGALTCYDHDDPGVWCCLCGEHGLTGPWREHMANALREAGLIPKAGMRFEVQEERGFVHPDNQPVMVRRMVTTWATEWEAIE